MKPFFIFVMIFIGIAGIFAAGKAQKTTDENLTVVTGGWHEIDKTELGETILEFANTHLEKCSPSVIVEQISTSWSVERVWTQLVQGRRYLLAYDIVVEITNKDDLPVDTIRLTKGLLILRRNFDGAITLEKDYRNSELLDFIGALLTGEVKNDFLENGGRL